MAVAMQSSLRAALTKYGCADDDIPRVWSALVSLGLTSPSDWCTDLIHEADFKGAGLSVLLSRKATHANSI